MEINILRDYGDGYMMTKRIKPLLSGMLAVMAGLFLMACSSDAVLPRLSGDAVILAFGDSLTFGIGAAPAESYPAVLERLTGRRVVNSGVPGEVTGEGLSRLPGVLATENPALMILCHGGNDLLRHLNKQETAGNLREMIRLTRERGTDVVIIAVPSPDLSLSPPQFYRETAGEFNLLFDEKTLAEVLSDRSLKSDYIHPNAAGYRKLAEMVALLLRKNGAVE